MIQQEFHYCWSEWITSSQKAFDLCQSGTKIWRRADLRNVEKQLQHISTSQTFTLRRIDGTTLQIKNPMYGVEKPLWTPTVRYREYWALVDHKAKEPAETYNCSYIIEWKSMSEKLYRGPQHDCEALFHSWREKWDNSVTCKALKDCITRFVLASQPSAEFETASHPIKILCFGLGDLNFKAPNWWYLQNREQPEHQQETESSLIENPMVHHAIALTIRETVQAILTNRESDGSSRGDDHGEMTNTTRLLTQDPQYTPSTISLLARAAPEFTVVGPRGAAGFAELDDRCIVFAPFVNAPINQIIADLARPMAIITPAYNEVIIFDQRGIPCGNPESPRSRDMWKEYNAQDFPLVEAERDVVKGSLRQLKIYSKK